MLTDADYPCDPPRHRAYDLWSFQVIPPLGHILASDRDSYQVRLPPPLQKKGPRSDMSSPIHVISSV